MRLTADKCAKLFCGLFITIALFSCAIFPHLSYCSSTPNHSDQSEPVMGESSSQFLSTNQHLKNINNVIQIEDNCTKVKPVEPTSAPFLEISTINTLKERVHLEIKSSRDYYDETITLNDTTQVVYIKCKAPYPIDFEYNGHVSNRQAKATSIKRLGNACFEVEVEVTAFSPNTGNYSCFSVKNRQVRSSYYIYFTPMFKSLLINREQNITIRPGPRDTLVRIPCPTSNPNFVMKLEKQITNSSTKETSWVDYSNSSNIFEGYDPKFGWSFKLAEFKGINKVQFYRCTSTYNEMDWNVIQVFPFKSYSDIDSHEDASLLSAEEKELNDQGTESESDGAHSNLHHHHHHHNHNHKEITSSRRVTNYRDLVASCSQESGELRSFDCSTWIECRMRQCRIHEMECPTRSSCSKSADNCPNSIIQCLRVGMEPVTLIYYHGLNRSKNFFTDQDHVPLKDILSVSVKRVKRIVTTSGGDPNPTQNGNKSPAHPTNSDDSYTDSKVTFVCTGSSFMFCIHFQWTIKMSDGHSIVIPTENVTNNKWNKTSAYISSEVEIQVLRGFQEIQCSAPVWNRISVQSVSLRRDDVFRQMTSFDNITTNHNSSSGALINRLLMDQASCWLLACAACILFAT